jgi:large subunit ribosomal protein L1
MGKNNKSEVENINLKGPKTIAEASALLPNISRSKFVGSVDIDIVLSLKENQKKESVRGSVNLPNASGDAKRVVVLCEEKDVKRAKDAGAVDAGLADLAEKIEKGTVGFDVVVATPEVMPKIVKLGKVLGPKGLMPNPKNGTVTSNIAETIQGYASGKTDFKMLQGQGVIRGKIGKLDLTPEQIEANIYAFLKGVYAETKKLNAAPFKKVTVSPTMGPGLRIDNSDIIARIY